MNNDSEILELEGKVRSIMIQGKTAPIFLYRFDELPNYLTFNELKNKVAKGDYTLIIPNQMLHQYHSVAMLRKYYLISLSLLYVPYFVSIFFAVFGVINENYWLLSTIPVIFFAQFSSGFFSPKLVNYFLLACGIFLFAISKFLIGALLITFSATIISSIYFRVVRKLGFLHSALNSEILFCFLFYVRTVSLYDKLNNRIIKSL